jgi:hypothetical protein
MHYARLGRKERVRELLEKYHHLSLSKKSEFPLVIRFVGSSNKTTEYATPEVARDDTSVLRSEHESNSPLSCPTRG